MKAKFNLVTLAIAFCLSGPVYSAGGPMNEDLTPLIPGATAAVEAGNRGDADEFVKSAEKVLTLAMTQPTSASSQRIVSKMKLAVNQGKAGKLAEGTAAVKKAMTDRKKKGI